MREQNMGKVERAGNGVKPGFPTNYDPAIGLLKLMRRTLKDSDKNNISKYITEENVKLPETSFQIVRPWVEPLLKKETCQQAWYRLVSAGLSMASPADLAGFLFHHPQEWEKWRLIMAIHEVSLWRHGRKAYAVGAYNKANKQYGYGQWNFRDWKSFADREGVLVLAPSSH